MTAIERDTRKATLTAAGRSLLPDARAVISRIEEMKTRAVSIAEAGVPQASIAVDTSRPRAHVIECLGQPAPRLTRRQKSLKARRA